MAETETVKRKVTDLGNGFCRVDIRVKDSNRPEGQQEVSHSYRIPTESNFLHYLTNGKKSVVNGKEVLVLETRKVTKNGKEVDESVTLSDIYDKWSYAVDLAERASVRLAVAAESTFIIRDKVRIDLLALDTDAHKAIRKACAAVNAAYGLVAVTGGDVPTAFAVTKRKLLEAGSVVEQNGAIVPKPSK